MSNEQDVTNQSMLQYGNRIIVITMILGLAQVSVLTVTGVPVSVFVKVFPLVFVAHAIPSFLVLLLAPQIAERSRRPLLLATNILLVAILFIGGVIKILHHLDESSEVLAKLTMSHLATVWIGMIYCLGIYIASAVTKFPLDLHALNPWPWLVTGYKAFSYGITAILLMMIVYTVVMFPFERDSLGIPDELSEQSFRREIDAENAFVAKNCRNPNAQERREIHNQVRSQMLSELGKTEESLDCDRFPYFCQSLK